MLDCIDKVGDKSEDEGLIESEDQFDNDQSFSHDRKGAKITSDDVVATALVLGEHYRVIKGEQLGSCDILSASGVTGLGQEAAVLLTLLILLLPRDRRRVYKGTAQDDEEVGKYKK